MPPNHAASTERPLKPRSTDSAAFDTSHLVVQYRGYMRLCDSGNSLVEISPVRRTAGLGIRLTHHWHYLLTVARVGTFTDMTWL